MDNYDREWWTKNISSFRAKVTRGNKALKTDPQKALKTANDLFATMERYGYPDEWHNVQRLKDDATMAVRRANKPVGLWSAW